MKTALRGCGCVLAAAALLAGCATGKKTAAGAGAGPAAAAGKKPNILFILADDLGYGDVGWLLQKKRAAEGKPAIETPALDRLAENGVRLTAHYAGVPVCAPSRGCLLTGRHAGNAPLRDNCFDWPLPRAVTLGTVMRDAGYETYAVGKWGLAGGGSAVKRFPERESMPTDCGFDHFYGFLDHCGGHTYYHYDAVLENNAHMGIYEDRTNATATAVGRYSTDLFTARIKAYLADRVKRGEKRPFFLYYAVNAIHGSHRSDASLKNKHLLHVPGGPYPAGAGLSGGVRWPLTAEPLEKRNTWIDPRYRGLLGLPAGEYRARYATAITRMDTAIADLMQTLRDLKLDRDTIVVFTSDNGPAEECGASPKYFRSAGPFDGMKRSVYEGGVREPTLVSWPGRLAPREVAVPSSFCDWMATFADAAGLPAPAISDGRSLLPDLRGEKPAVPPVVYSEYNGGVGGGKESYAAGYAGRKGGMDRVRGHQQMIRVGDMVALRIANRKTGGAETPIRLYDVAKDPFQERDLAGDPAYAGALKKMAAALARNRVPAPDPVFRKCFDADPAPALTADELARAPRTLTRRDFPAPAGLSYVPAAPAQGTAAAPAAPFASWNAPALPAAGVHLIEGLVKAPATGSYVFSAAGAGGAHVRIHGAHVLAKERGDKGQASGTVWLEAGSHPMRVWLSGPVSVSCPGLGVSLKTE